MISSDRRRIEAFTPSDLMRMGIHAFNQGRYQAAKEIFRKIIQYFPKALKARAAIYNLALVAEKLRRYPVARRLYQKYLGLPLHRKDRLETMIRLGICFHEEGRYIDAARAFEQVLKEDLGPEKKAQAYAGLGRALIKKGDLGKAERVLSLALAWIENTRAVAPSSSHYPAECAFLYGRVAHLQMTGSPLRLPADRMEQDFVHKTKLFLKARKRYFAVVEMGSAHWALSALDRVGEMLFDLMVAMREAPLPRFRPVRFFDSRVGRWKTIARERLEEHYIKRIRLKIRVLILKAIRTYERNLFLARKMPVADYWMLKSRQEIRKLKKTLEKMESMPIGRKPRGRHKPRFSDPIHPDHLHGFRPSTLPL